MKYSICILVITMMLSISACVSGGDDDDDSTGQSTPGVNSVTLSADEETSVVSYTPDTNYNDLTLLVQNYIFTTKENNARSYIYFDISSIPANTRITEARVELYYCACDGIDEIAVYSADGSWDASTLTWNNQPGPKDLGQPLDIVNLEPNFMTTFDCGNRDEYVASAGSKASKEGWFITDLVQSWIDGSETNNGIVFMAYPELINPDPPGRLFAIFGNTEDTGDSGACSTKVPRLHIEY